MARVEPDLLEKLSDPETCFFCLGRLMPYEENLLKCEKCGFIVNRVVALFLRRLLSSPLIRRFIL